LYESEVLDLNPADLYAKFFAGVRKISALSLAIGYPTIASLPHILGNGFRKLLAISLATNYEFKEAKMFKDAAASGAASAAAAPAASSSATAAKVEAAAPKEEPEEEEDLGLGGGLFGDD